MFGKWNFPWLALVLFSSLAAAVRADELLEPIAQDDTYLDQDVEPQAPSRAARIKAQMVNDETVSSSSSIVPDVQQCAWADDDCGWASKVSLADGSGAAAGQLLPLVLPLGGRNRSHVPARRAFAARASAPR